MSYPMTYQRVVKRWHLDGDYDNPRPPRDAHGQYDYDKVDWLRSMVAGDLRRLERDQRDALQLIVYAEAAGITVRQAKAVLDAFFGEPRP